MKVSLIVTIKNFNEKNLKECITSLTNQSLKEIEILCVLDESIPLLEDFKKKDSRIQIINTQNNLKNEGLIKSHGEYVAFIDSNDWVDFDFCKKTYQYAKENDLDILMYKILNNQNGNWSEDYYYNFFNFDETLNGKVFSHRDISDILFSIPQDVSNKIYKKKFLDEIKTEFYENLIFEDTLLFFKSILKAKRISILNEYIYFKRNFKHPNLIDEKIITDILDIAHNIFLIFKKSNLFEFYKKQLYNYKFNLIRYWYFSLDYEIQNICIDNIYNDFLSTYIEKSYLKRILIPQNLFFYEVVIEFPNAQIINLYYENKNLRYNNRLLNDLNMQFKKNQTKILQNEKQVQNLKNENEQLKEQVNEIRNDSNDIYHENIRFKEDNVKIQSDFNIIISENQQLKENINQLQNEFNRVIVENEQLKKQINELQNDPNVV